VAQAVKGGEGEAKFHTKASVTVTITLRDDGRTSTATSEGQAYASEKYLATENAQKIAINNARKAAFDNVVLILLPTEDGVKTAVYILGVPLPPTLKLK